MTKVAFVLLLSISSVAVAQTACPVGVAPGSPQCGPSSLQEGALPPQPRINYVPTGRWIKTWGAVAWDDNGAGGAVTGELSEDDARREAMEKCSLKSPSCKVAFTYKNRCAAVSWTPDGKGSTYLAPSPEIAEANALKVCRDRQGVGCKIVYSDCSTPVFREY